MTAHVLAGDPSLTSFGAATITTDQRVTTWVRTTDPLPCREGHQPCRDKHLPDLLDVHGRVRGQARWFCDLVTTGTKLVVLEGPAHGAQHGQPDERAGLRWLVLNWLIRQEVPVALVGPTRMKWFVTGKGNADKALVRRTVNTLWPGHGLARVTTDEADAVGLAGMGVCWLGWKGPWFDARALAIETGAQWPERDTVTA